jgi:hypothetical protein
MQHTGHPVSIVLREEFLPGLGDEANLPVVLVAEADTADQHLARSPIPWTASIPPPHLHAVRPTALAVHHLAAAPLEDVVGEEVDVACRLVEVVGAEALVDLWREDLFPFVELHDDLYDVTGVDPIRVERGTHPLLAGLRDRDPPSPPGSLVTFHTLIGHEEKLALAPLGLLAHSTIYTHATDGMQDAATDALEEVIS